MTGFDGDEFACDDDGDEAKADNGLLGGVVIVMIVVAIAITTITVIVDHNVGVGGLGVVLLLFICGFIIILLVGLAILE